MNEYAFSIAVEEREDLFEALDGIEGVVGAGRAGALTDVSFLVSADDAVRAAFEASCRLVDHGIQPRRIYVDIVSTSDIAERTGVSRQTVRNWQNAERRAGFPAHYATAGNSRLWLWSDVYAWLQAEDIPCDELYQAHPLDSETVDTYNGRLAGRRLKSRVGWVKPATLPPLEERDPVVRNATVSVLWRFAPASDAIRSVAARDEKVWA